MSGPYQYRFELAEQYFKRGGDFLDVGCGAGLSVRKYATLVDAEPYGIDVINANQGEIDFQVFDGLTIPFEDERFSSMTVIHVLHHASDPERLVAEISRVLKRGHRVLILEDMASSRLQNFITKALDLYHNKVRNFLRWIIGQRRREMTQVPMAYGIRTYPEWIQLFKENGLEVVDLRSISHRFIEHGAFVLERVR